MYIRVRVMRNISICVRSPCNLKLSLQEVENVLVGGGVGVAKVETVAGLGDNAGLEGLGLLEHRLGVLEDVGGAAVDGHGVVAVTAAEGNVTVTSDDEDASGELVGHHDGRAKAEKLAEGGGLAVHGARLEHVGREVTRAKELLVDADRALGGNVTGDVLVREVLDAADGDKVTAEGKLGHETGSLAESGQDDGVGHVGVLAGVGVGHGRTERVADVDVLGEAVVDAANVAVVQTLGQLLQGSNLEVDLDLVDGVTVRRLSDAQAVPGQGRVALLDGLVDVAVVVVVEGVVPVAAVKADTVGEDLDGVARAVVRLTVRGSKLVLALDRLHAAHDALHELVGHGAGELEDNVGHLNLALGGLQLEIEVLRGDVDRDADVLAVLGRRSGRQGESEELLHGNDIGSECEGVERK